MAAIKGKDTKPELQVRRFLHSSGFRFRLHNKDLPGKPDIVLKKYNTVVFVNGCFWHRHIGCKLAYSPKTRVEFWEEKFNSNIERDERNDARLKQLGWRVITVWECEVKNKNFEEWISERIKNV